MQKSVLIVDDEPLIADDLSFHLEDLGISDIQISLKYEDALEKLSKGKFDLVLLDVNLSGERDGIDIANFILRQNSNTPFIFITSYYDKQTIERAKKCSPIAYIVKPFDQKDIYVNVEMAFHKLDIETKKASNNHFFIKDREGLLSIDPAEINYVEAFDNYAKVHATDQSFIISHTLKSIGEKLEPFGFERIHKSYLVNFSRITRISEGYVFFDEINVPIGRGYKSGFMAKLSLL